MIWKVWYVSGAIELLEDIFHQLWHSTGHLIWKEARAKSEAKGILSEPA